MTDPVTFIVTSLGLCDIPHGTTDVMVDILEKPRYEDQTFIKRIWLPKNPYNGQNITFREMSSTPTIVHILTNSSDEQILAKDSPHTHYYELLPGRTKILTYTIKNSVKIWREQ